MKNLIIITFFLYIICTLKSFSIFAAFLFLSLFCLLVKEFKEAKRI